jgi:hypothetical protein
MAQLRPPFFVKKPKAITHQKAFIMPAALGFTVKKVVQSLSLPYWLIALFYSPQKLQSKPATTP